MDLQSQHASPRRGQGTAHPVVHFRPENPGKNLWQDHEVLSLYGSPLGSMKDRDKLCMALRLYSPKWQENPCPFQCTTEQVQGHEELSLLQTGAHAWAGSGAWCNKHLDWVDACLVTFLAIFVSHLPEKWAMGCLQEDFIFTHRKSLICGMSHAAGCPVLAQCHVLQHFLTGPCSTNRRPGNKRNTFCMALHLSRKEYKKTASHPSRAGQQEGEHHSAGVDVSTGSGHEIRGLVMGDGYCEKGDMVGASFFLTLSTPPPSPSTCRSGEHD
ncbi:hypothetical protein P7K49_033744 [Saguinus oedipus]|uniref:Uncharacterized protein n=1 Tax=Saguinus oedipus TaxID=9490 RepID=A0ABQ9TSU2_SAGOE|nr:hypothetical protein P7K49_033744 [Saguinus oedipus]